MMSLEECMANKVTDEEVKTVEGLVGAKAGIAIASQMELLNSKTFAIPAVLGGIAAMFLPGKETEKKIKKTIKLVKEAKVDKATIVFQKLSKCAHPAKKKKMMKKAGLGGIATTALIAGSIAPKPRKTVMTVPDPKNPEKNLKMKDMINLPRKK
jgi:hypothetical protein